MNAQDEKFTRSALTLAAKGISSVEPNPAVGCVIVKAGQLIGKGYHQKFGGPHAEINALADCRTLGVAPEGATLYVTLEPCCHQGKTGPCTEAIIKARIARVVAATLDPSEHANGKGLEQLRRAGIEVEVGLCEQEARRLNAPFFKHVTTGKAWVVLKWAQSLDGKLAYTDPSAEKRWITNEVSRSDAHRLRRRVGAILVGINTVLADDPLLTPRPSKGRKPIRVVLDDALQVPLGCRLLRTTKTSPVLIYTRKAAVEAKAQLAGQIHKKGAEVLVYDGPGELPDLRFLLDTLGQRGVQQILVEGGPRVAASFLREGLVDEMCMYVAPKVLGAGGTASLGEAMAALEPIVGLHYVQIKALGDDVRISGRLENSPAPEKVRDTVANR
ncbi:MAG: bifunctional diaminohydroxyphosphoribosylaminopyrimidine deaminase/5-amino-6-(5-phosphoribosylamino)uracil reductase RibD [Planctomycetes bacterium]|nr:bifunctional diaminohydroxyphosphoribosylaminopyrimidine deaminase/5-amino-6-(5-phosphoribosylamino)uracil reductase RibD [Planctomycetota bacterium]